MGAAASESVTSALTGTGSMSSSNAVDLYNLPAELIELIALSTADEASLRALSSTCRKFRQILYPRFLDFFKIECSLSETRLWAELTERPLNASLIRHLTIDPRLDSRPRGRVPTWLRSSTASRSPSGSDSVHAALEDEAARIAALTLSSSSSSSSLSPALERERDEEDRFVKALRNMTNLSKLIWRHNPPHDSEMMWSTLLRHCGKITDLEIADRDTGGFRGDRPVRDTLPSIHFSRLAAGLHVFNLTRLVWYTSASDPDDFIVSKLGPLEEVLVHSCHNLQELRIRQCSPHVINYAGTLLARAHWPDLSILELSHFHAGDCEAVAHFFDRHPLIHTLILEQADFTSGQYVDLEEIADDALPNLEVLCAGIDNVNALLRAPAGMRAKLRKIYGVQFDTPMRRTRRPTTWSSSGEGAKLIEGLARATSLRELEGEFAIVIADKLDLVRLFASCAHLTSLKIKCSFAGLLETFMPAFAFLKHIRTMDLPLQHFDVLPLASMVHNSLTLRMGSGTGFISMGTRTGSPNMSSSPVWGGYPVSSPSSPSSPSSSSARTISSGGGAGGMTFVSGLQRRVRMIADVCPELESVRFGGGMGGLAKVTRYPGSTEVSSVELAEESEVAPSDLRLTQAKASGWPPYGGSE
ncbi:hypothetical protein V8E36_009231 [Tilletia maclaganii]